MGNCPKDFTSIEKIKFKQILKLYLRERGIKVHDVY